MILSVVKELFPAWKPNPPFEGNRVGYWCLKCNKPLHLGTEETRNRNSASQFIDVIHKPCGTAVESIWGNR